MDVDYRIEKDMVIFEEKEPIKEERKKHGKVLNMATKNLKAIVMLKLDGKLGDC